MEIRLLTEISEFERVIELQRTVWGMDDLEIQPTDTFAVANKTGGGTVGAFQDQQLVGFCLGLAAIKDGGGNYLHSHMLGVLPTYSNQGIGRALKLWQRQWAQTRGFELIEWTFDPLQVKNTFFNVERLGAIVRRCYLDLYGSTSNILDGGLPTDRCVAEWWINSDRVNRVMDERGTNRFKVVHRVKIPVETQALRTTDVETARKLQRDIINQLSEYFAEGLALVGVERLGDVAEYLIGNDGPDS